jgi:hypothetical protein
MTEKTYTYTIAGVSVVRYDGEQIGFQGTIEVNGKTADVCWSVKNNEENRNLYTQHIVNFLHRKQHCGGLVAKDIEVRPPDQTIPLGHIDGDYSGG